MSAYYEVNVSKDGVHQFATSPWSIKTKEDAIFVFELISSKFTYEEGFSVEIYKIHEKAFLENSNKPTNK